MQAETIFQIANYIAFASWALLLALPRHRVTQILLGCMIVPLVFAALYLVLMLVYAGQSEGGFGSLWDVALLFQHPHILLAGWVHYLCFDLFVGIWESQDAQRRGISRWLVAPCQVLTLFAGPIGLLAYFAVRSIVSRNFEAAFE